MKKLTLFALLITGLPAFAQQSQTGKITAKQTFPKAGIENTYTYTPPKGLIISAKAQVAVLYAVKPSYKLKRYPLHKKGLAYEFSLPTPDSTRAFVANIVDENNKTIDNNNDHGYLVTLYDKNNKKFPASNIACALLLKGIGASYFKLKVSIKEITKLFEEDFKQDSTAKEKYYYTYVYYLYADNKESGKPKFAEYAKTLLTTNDEPSWIKAYYIYYNLKMEDEKKQLEAKILKTFPDGEMARNNAMSEFYKAKDPAEKIAKKAEYLNKFPNSGISTIDVFYKAIATAYANNKDWPDFYKYVDSVSDKNQLHASFNNIAWPLSGENLEKPGTDLETAKNISFQSLTFVQNIINNPAKYSSDYNFIDAEFADGMQNTYNTYADTYALILYKLGKYDSAFYYQSIAVKDVHAADIEELERYCAYAEKVKGADFIKRFLEEQVASGKGTPAMKAQLKTIYQKANLPEADYDKIIAQAEAKAKEKVLKDVKALEKKFKALDFTLKNLQGETVSLAGLKGKVVVLDFWATWCGPCKASFPGMQIALNKYKDDKDVVFLFVDTWESKEPAKMKEDAALFVKDNKYTFNVVLDEKDKTVSDYKVEGIPTKFIINKAGIVKYQSIGFSGNADELVEELSLMIENAKK
jgi:Peroxiredoxin